MPQKLLKSVFMNEFNLHKFKKLIAEMYEQTIETENVATELTAINSFLRLPVEGSKPAVLVLEVKQKLEWNFKLRKLLADYLAQHGEQQAVVAFTTAADQSWYCSLIKRDELSSYVVQCYSIPVGTSSCTSNLAQVQKILKPEALTELTNDFASGLKEEFMAECNNHYELLLEEITNLFEENSGVDLDMSLAGLTQKVLIKVVFLYLLEQKNLLEIEFKSELEISVQQKIIKLAEAKTIDRLGPKQEKVILPQAVTGIEELWTILSKYNFVLSEDTPWAQIWALTPAVLADVNENLLTANQRKNSGVFYTPEQVVHYMGQETIINYLTTKVTELSYQQAQNLVQEKNLSSVEKSLLPQIYQKLSEIKFCDPAVGSGAFALGMVKELLRTKEVVVYLINDQINKQEQKINTIKNSLHCLDIDRQAVAITQFRLWTWTAVDTVTTLIDLKQQVVVTNPLYKIERNLEQRDEELAAVQDDYQQQSTLAAKKDHLKKLRNLRDNKLGAKFSLVDYFPAVFKQGGFDIVLGNPPYVGEKGNKEIFREIKKYSLGRFYSGKMDLFYFFFHLGLDIAAKKGIVALITTNYYLTATGAYYLREDLSRRSVIKKLVDFNNLRLFPAASGQHNLITILQKNEEADKKTVAETIVTSREGDAEQGTLLEILAGVDEKSNYYTIPQPKLYQGQEKYLRLEVGKIDDLLSFVAEQGHPLGELCQINQGIVSGCDKVSKRHIKQYDLPVEVKGTGIFVLTAAEVETLDLTAAEQHILRPWFKNSDIERYWSRSQAKGEYLLYLKDAVIDLPAAIKKHLKPFRPILKVRREVKSGRIKWWELQWPRQQEIFEQPKLLVPQRSKTNTFAYNETAWYASADVYYITQPDAEVKLKYILALLNSSLYYLWFYYKGKKKGNLLELYQKPLTEVPIKVAAAEQQQIFIDLVEEIQTKKKKIKEYQDITFTAVREDKQLTTESTLKEIIKDKNGFKTHYHGQAKIVRSMKVEIKAKKIIIYSAKSSSGYYKLIEFAINNNELRKYIKFYLENMTHQQLEDINQTAESSIINRLVAIRLPGYYEQDKIQAIVDYWEQIKANQQQLQAKLQQLEQEIDELVYQLYDFSTAEIEFLTKKVEELKSN